MLLEQFDKCKTSTFDPSDVACKVEGFPSIAITCFAHNLIDGLVKAYNPEIVGYVSNANGKNPIYKINYDGLDVAVFMSSVGAAACCVGYEEIFAMGLEKLIVFGTCGVLSKDIEDLAIIIPTSAVRDEGTSYHYLEASDEIEVNFKHKDEFKKILDDHKCSYVEGKVWTTDAPYRETRDKVKIRKESGCICVDMECSAIHAIAQFREKDVFQFFYAADNLDDSSWNQRSLSNNDRLSEKEKIVYLALELAKKIAK